MRLRQAVAVLTDYPVLFPLDGRRTRYRVSSGFGSRTHPLKGRRMFHKGVDLAAPYGEPVYAAGNGKVSEAVTAVATDGSSVSAMRMDTRPCTRT